MVVGRFWDALANPAWRKRDQNFWGHMGPATHYGHDPDLTNPLEKRDSKLHTGSEREGVQGINSLPHSHQGSGWHPGASGERGGWVTRPGLLHKLHPWELHHRSQSTSRAVSLCCWGA